MAESIIDGTGITGSVMKVNADGSINVSGVSVGAINTGSESFIYGKSGTSWYPVKVKADGTLESSASVTVDSVYVASGNAPFGYENNEILRYEIGSPGSVFVFSSQTQSFMVDNLGTTPVYFKFNSVADTGSTSGFLAGEQFRSFDCQVGSVGVVASGNGTETSNVQVFRLS